MSVRDVFVPAGLNPGDEYQLVFVTSGVIGATSPDIAVYNDFVNAQAALNPSLTGTDMGVTYSAIASTPFDAANVNALVEAPVYLLDSSLVANGFADLWDGTIMNPIGLTQFATAQPPGLVWTGSLTTGEAFVDLELGSALGRAIVGFNSQTDGSWIQSTNFDSFPAEHSIYALSETLTVGVPEPSSFVAFVGMGLIGVCRRRSRAV